MPLAKYTSFAALSVFCLSCDSGKEIGENPCDTFETTLTINDAMAQPATTFNVGENIVFSLRIRNTTNSPATLTAATSCTAVVFETFNAAKQRQWGSVDGIACVQAEQPRTYAPLEAVTYSNTWTQRGPGNVQVPVGTYTVNADVGQYMKNSKGNTFTCRAEHSKNKTFVIQ